MQGKFIINKNMEKINGLTNKEVEERIAKGQVNYDTSVKTKSIKAIIYGNIFTIFNLLNFALAIIVFCAGAYRNLLFMGVVICNTLISTYQEIHSKKVIDKLSVVSCSKVEVIRDGKKSKIGVYDLVLDDVFCLSTGNQIVTDSVLLDGEVEVNESFITGEPDTIFKKAGDTLLSGSFVVSGNGTAKVVHIAGDNYTAKISADTKYIEIAKSEIMTALNKVIKIVSFLILPAGILLFLNQMAHSTANEAIVRTVAALIGMIPEGLILLTSTVLAVSVVRLAKSKVLVQELYCIETLARVDTLCLDKTGTITEGKMEVCKIIPEELSEEQIEEILGEFANASEDKNVSIEAIRQKYKAKHKWEVESKVAFSSQKKWSGICFKEHGSYILGAPEIIIKDEKILEKIKEEITENRVLVLTHSKENIENKELPQNMEICGFVAICDIIRKDAKNTLNYFEEQKVDIKVISGDNPVTVSNIAKKAGIKNYDKYIDVSKLNSEELEEAVTKYTIFGRVSPTQKRELVQALKKNGHTVAMTGDGVNDVLALKEADCSVAMGAGSDAARNVSKLVLLDSNFKSMPKIVAEGRRTINNIERSSELFLVKTIYSSILAILFVLLPFAYPFRPIQLTLVNVVAIGIPSFVLALQPNKEKVSGDFLKKILTKSIPTALTVVFNIILATFVCRIFNIAEHSSICVLLTALTGFTLLYKLCRPFNALRTTLFVGVISLFLFEITAFRELYYMEILSPIGIRIFIILAVISLCMQFILETIINRKRRKTNY